MNQALVTDYFNASRKNVRRNSKKVSLEKSAVENISKQNSPKVQKAAPSVSGVKRLKNCKHSTKSLRPIAESSVAPAFKRFRHLVPSENEKSDINAVSSSTPSTSQSQPEQANESVDSSANSTRPVFQSRLKDSDFKRDSGALSVSSESCRNAFPSKRSNVSSKPPAYQRFAHLVPTVPKPEDTEKILVPSLPLPFVYKNLSDMFKAMDNVACMLCNRKELISFAKLQESVTKVVRRDFQEKTFGQIRKIYGGSYSARYEKNIPKFGRKVSANYELIVDVTLKDDETPMSRSEESRLVFNGTRLVQRREMFTSKIMKILMAKHEEFLLKELDISRADLPPLASLKRWHPRFPLDRLEPPGEEPLPQRPDAKENRILSAQEAVALFKSKGLDREAESCERAVLKLCGAPADAGKSLQSPALTGSPDPKKDNRLRNVSQSLLEKIRAKEAAKAAQLLSRGGPEWEKRRSMLSRLPNIAVHTWNLFATSRKPALTLSYLCEKISDSHPSGLSPATVGDHLRLLSKTMPGWLELLEWATPHARIVDMKRNLAEVRATLVKVAENDGPDKQLPPV